MPLYDYKCSDCGKRFSQLIGMTADSKDPLCPACGSKIATRLISRFARIRSDDEVLASLEDAAMSADDPAAVGEFAREIGHEMADDLGEDYEAFVEETERGIMDSTD